MNWCRLLLGSILLACAAGAVACLVLMDRFAQWVRRSESDPYIVGITHNRLSKRSLEIVNEFGHCHVAGACIIRRPFRFPGNMFVRIFLLLPGVLKDRISTNIAWNTPQGTPKHAALHVRLEKPDGRICTVCIDKHPSIRLMSDIRTGPKAEVEPLAVAKNKYTLVSLLDDTRVSMGDDRLLNWELTTNNCESFVRELARNLGHTGEAPGCSPPACYAEECTDMGLQVVQTIANIHFVLQNGLRRRCAVAEESGLNKDRLWHAEQPDATTEER
jgi:hypothetical protein